MKKACVKCGAVAEPKTITKGSLAIEIVMWLLLIVPGVIYSVWRISSRHEGCRVCGGVDLVPINSPKGQEIAGGSGYDPAADESRLSRAAQSGGKSLGRLVARMKK